MTWSLSSRNHLRGFGTFLNQGEGLKLTGKLALNLSEILGLQPLPPAIISKNKRSSVLSFSMDCSFEYIWCNHILFKNKKKLSNRKSNAQQISSPCKQGISNKIIADSQLKK
jgi:hypothetical protein